MPHSHIHIMFNFTLYVCVENFHTMNIDVQASIGAPPLNTQCLGSRLICYHTAKLQTWCNAISNVLVLEDLPWFSPILIFVCLSSVFSQVHAYLANLVLGVWSWIKNHFVCVGEILASVCEHESDTNCMSLTQDVWGLAALT